MSVLLLVCAVPGSADELLMKDGSRLLGKVVKKENGTLEFETTFAGVIKVQWAEVSELHADEPVTVMLENEETTRANTIKNTKTATLLETDAGRTGQQHRAGGACLHQSCTLATGGGRPLDRAGEPRPEIAARQYRQG